MMRQKSSALSGFTEREYRYLMERNLARIALVCEDSQPHIIPVIYEFDGRYLYLSGWNLKYSPRFQNLEDQRITMLVDDLNSVNKLVPRGIEVTGLAETKEKDDKLYLKITPVTKTSWGL
jgi:PPOX class F420-dependent enzyme/OxyR family protein